MGHAGMDTSKYPGDAVMAYLRSNTNLVWCGFYLGPAPSHSGASWMSHRQHLVENGWGLAPIYVGQQETGPGSHEVDARHGSMDGENACKLEAAAGFPGGTILYLDMETGGPISRNAEDYLTHWCSNVAAGRYLPGAYLSYLTAASALHAVPDLKLWVFRLRSVDYGVPKSPPFRGDDPAASGVQSAVAWQWAQNCTIPVPGGTQLVDLDVASTQDPSKEAT